MELHRTLPDERRFIRHLYREAFPAQERKPFWRIRRQERSGILSMMTMVHEEVPVGFVMTVRGKHLVLVDYLAVAPQYRGRGFGTQALRSLQRQYPVPLFLEIERPEEGEDNQAQRLARHAFYTRCGFSDAGVDLRVFGVRMMLMTTAEHLRFADCIPVYEQGYGRYFRRYVREDV